MEKCLHVSKIRPAWDHSILNPEKWMCYLCGTTESVWACLSCANVACGRFNEKHALIHFEESKKIQVQSTPVISKFSGLVKIVRVNGSVSYVCDDYVMNDNAAGDLKLLRSALSAIATQKFTDIESRGRRLLRSYSHTGGVRTENTDSSDKLATAVWHQRQSLLGRTFSAWLAFVRLQKSRDKDTPKRQLKKLASVLSPVIKKWTLIPGVTGLRNLGNTCYINSVLQVLSHIDDFRDFFLKLNNYDDDVSPQYTPPIGQSRSPSTTAVKPLSPRRFYRQSTIDCFQHLVSSSPVEKPKSSQKKRSGGLNGGSTKSTPLRQQLICDVESKNQLSKLSLCEELQGLLRVLWSGKWAQVSPHAFLRAVWQAIPGFKGYAQHDAQEFLCELLDKVQRDIDSLPKSVNNDTHLLAALFEGQLVSQVTCLACGNVSQTYEPFMDLSLEFPNRYQITKQNSRISQDICHITEMLAKFTEEERLEGRIYACEKCNFRRRKSAGSLYTEARKQLLINKLPCVLRLHLKRFRWSGRYHREKISTHVAAVEVLDIQPFCSSDGQYAGLEYRLFGVIVHHGRGFGCGHYTAYTWNDEAGSWVNCNDSRMILSRLEDVLMVQAYILFYSLTPVKPPNSSRSPTSPGLTPPTSDTPTSPLPLISMDNDRTVEYSLQSESSDSFVLFDDEELTNPLSRQETVKFEGAADSVDCVESFTESTENSEAPVPLLKTDGTLETIKNEVSFNLKFRSRRSGSKLKRSHVVGANSTNNKRAKKMRDQDLDSGVQTNCDRTAAMDKNLQLFSKLLEKNSESTRESQAHKHIKRRKSTFW